MFFFKPRTFMRALYNIINTFYELYKLIGLAIYVKLQLLLL